MSDLDAITEKLIGIDQKVDAAILSIKGLDEAIRGNGEPGLKTTVALQGQEIETLKTTVEATAARRFNQFVLLWSCLAALAAAVIGSYTMVRMERNERVTSQQSNP